MAGMVTPSGADYAALAAEDKPVVDLATGEWEGPKPSSERDLIDQSIDKALEATDALLSGDMAKATATIHAGAQRPKPPKPPRPEGGPPPTQA